MFCSNFFSLCVIIYIFFFKTTSVYGFFDTTDLFDRWPFINECPNTFNITELEHEMRKSFFGQHIASKIILSALMGNLKRSKNNRKPLVMSFLGCNGCGKNFISHLIATHMFISTKVRKMRYHVINGHSEFNTDSKLSKKEQLLHLVKSAIELCGTNLFVIDDIHYIPENILDILIPIMENNDVTIDSRDSIFLLLTNTGSESILEKYLEIWSRGQTRNTLKAKDFDSLLQKTAFNENGGLKKSSLIDSQIIDHYVPFLPLEKEHVEQCIEAELKNLEIPLDSKIKSEILNILPFSSNFPLEFSTGGCKRINHMVSTHSKMNLFEDFHQEIKTEL